MLKANYFPSHVTGNVTPFISRRSAGYRITVLATVIALVSLVVASATGFNLFGGQITPDRQAAENPDPRTEFVYFPGQYVNQATEPSENIQGF